jgi:hypothetical protein
MYAIMCTTLLVGGAIRTRVFLKSQILTTVVMNIYVFWDIRLCSLLKVNLRFEGISRPIFRVEVEA